jgi:hypothetical protein
LQDILIYLVTPILCLIQGYLNLGNFEPHLLILFYSFLRLRSLNKRDFFIYFSFWESLFSSYLFYKFFLFWLIIEIIIDYWDKRFYLAHKSFSFLLIIILSLLNIIYWNYNLFLSLNIKLIEKILFFTSANLISFLPFYIFLKPTIEKKRYEER